MSAAAELEQVNPHITIDVGRSIAGATFRLYVGSKKHLQRLNPGARMWPRVFIDRGRPTDFEPIEPSLWRHGITGSVCFGILKYSENANHCIKKKLIPIGTTRKKDIPKNINFCLGTIAKEREGFL